MKNKPIIQEKSSEKLLKFLNKTIPLPHEKVFLSLYMHSGIIIDILIWILNVMMINTCMVERNHYSICNMCKQIYNFTKFLYHWIPSIPVC